MTNPRVLLVANDYLINLALKNTLLDSGFTVEAVYSGVIALAAIHNDPPWAVVTELDLGRGPDGFAVAHCARAARPGAAIVFISCHPSANDPAGHLTGSEFVPKPYRGEQVVAALRRATGLKAAA